MSQFIDRRKNGKNKSTVSRQRFLNRFKKQIKESVSKAIGERSITDIYQGEKISIPKKDINEPFFHHTKGGIVERVFPGNKEFSAGDKIPRPAGDNGGASGSQASDGEESEDEFSFELSKDEFLNIFLKI